MGLTVGDAVGVIVGAKVMLGAAVAVGAGVFDGACVLLGMAVFVGAVVEEGDLVGFLLGLSDGDGIAEIGDIVGSKDAAVGELLGCD